MSAAQHTGAVRQRGDDVVDDLVLAARIVLVRDIQTVTADEPHTKHDAFHTYALATLLFILVIPIVVYNIVQMRKLEAR